MAVTAKLKMLIQLMRRRKLSVLFLSETRTTSYHYYISEGFLCYFEIDFCNVLGRPAGFRGTLGGWN